MAEFSTIKEKVTILQLVDAIGVTNLKSGTAKVRGSDTSVLRGTCPCCKEGGDRAFIVYPATNSYYCWGQKHGGDVLELASRFYKIPNMKDVGKKLETLFNISAPRIPTGEKEFDAEGFGKSLDPSAPELQPLGIKTETLQLYGGGYCTRPSLKGKLALPVQDLDGNLLFIGIEIETTAIVYPKLKDAKLPYFFGEQRLEAGTLHVVHHPLDVLRSVDGNMENVLALLTPVTPDVLAKLKELMEAKQLETVEFHT